MHYFIDGYNLLFRLLPPKENLQLIREAFIYDLSYKASFLNLDATLVFDSHYQEGEASKSHVDKLEIIYTNQGESADDFILKSIKRSAFPKQHTVVTSDNKLAWQARRLLTNTMSVEDFVALLEKRYKNGQAKQQESPDTTKASKKIQEATTLLPTPTPSKGSMEYYIEAFEKEYKVLESAPREVSINIPSEPLKFETFEEFEEEETTPIQSDEERWLKIFEERIQKMDDDDEI